jgi:hypothetical protein
MRPLSNYIALTLLVWNAGCAAATGTAGTPTQDSSVPAASRGTTRETANVITREMIESTKEPNTYNLVRNLRPDWLRKRGVRGGGAGADVVVYLDGMRVGDPGYLQQIPTQDVKTIRHLSGPEADTRFGRGHEYGAILVSSRSAT